MLAYTNFPNYCCLCLRPDPDGSWRVSNAEMKYVGEGRYRTKGASVHVPVCSSCRWDLWYRRAAAVIGALGVAGGVFAWWHWDTKGDPNYLVAGVIVSLVVGFLVLIVLSWLFHNKFTKVAHIEPDGTDIRFANPEYQRMYTGESREWRQDVRDDGEGRWR
jgi:hypothetical protein